MAPFIDTRRLAGRAEKLPGEQVRQRRVIVPVGDQAPQQVGTPQERAVCRRRAAQDDVIAAAGSGVASVEHELLGREAHLPRVFIERGGLFDELVPVAVRVDVDLDHARIRGDEKIRQPRIARRRVALEQHAHAERTRRGFDGGDQIQVVVDRLDRRHEDIQDAAAGLDAQRGTDHAGGRFAAGRRACRCRRRPAREGRPGVAAGACRIGHGRRASGVAPAGPGSPCRPGGRERLARRKRVELVESGVIVRRRPGKRVERQPESHRRVAGHQIEPLAAQEPSSGRPTDRRVRRPVAAAARNRRPPPGPA